MLIVLGTAVSVMLSRSLGPDGRGKYATVVAIASISIALLISASSRYKSIWWPLGDPLQHS